MIRASSRWWVALVVAVPVCIASLTVEEPRRIPQAWVSSGAPPVKEIDSLAAGRMADGQVRLYATVKSSHRVDVYDAATGRFLSSIGKSGTGPGEFRYPNGIVVVALSTGDGGARSAILVVERDNARVQAFWADSHEPAGQFGKGELDKPYGCAISRSGGRTTLYVTDDGEKADRRVHIYELGAADGVVKARHVRSFGDADGPGKIRSAETIVADDRNERLLICDEDERDIKIYTLDGRFAGRTLAGGRILGDPEGLALLDGPENGLVVATDQRKDLSLWHAFCRSSLEPRFTFTGATSITNTDGICVFAEPFGPFPQGAMFAVNNDRDIHAFALQQVVETPPADGRSR